MIKNFTYTLILFLFSSGFAFAQTGSISGTVKSAVGNNLAAVTISVKGTNRASLTDENGNYQVNNVNPGSRQLVITFIGFKKQEKTVIVKAGETTIVNFILADNTSELEEVSISGKAVSRGSELASKMPLKNLENPQVSNSVSIELIKQQGLVSFDDAFRNIPGISRTWASTGRAGDGGTYFALRGFDAQSALVNGLPNITNGDMDLANIEEIQVIKGPSATLFGGSFFSYGGLINTITKKPYYNFGGEVTYNVGSFGMNRVSADINTPLSKTEKIALRVNTSYHTENSFQNAGFKKSFFVSPALAYQVNDRLKFDIMTEIYQQERAVAPVFFHTDREMPMPFNDVKGLGLNYNESFISNDLTIKNPRFNMQAQMNYKISDEWSSQTAISSGVTKADGIYSYIYGINPEDGTFGQDYHIENFTTNTFNIQQNFNGDFKIGESVRNRVVLGLDYYTRTFTDNGSGWATGRYVTPQNAVTTYIDPNTLDTIPGVSVNRQYVDALLAGTGNASTKFSNRSLGAYVSDVISFTPGLMAMGSLRVDRYEAPALDFDQFAFSYKLGLVYQPVIDKVSLFGNYMDAFINNEPSALYDDEGNPTGEVQTFKPEHATQWEVGTKLNLFDGKLGGTISYYNIKVSDRVYSIPGGQSKQGGNVRSRGFEVDLNANPAPGLTLIAGYSHNSNKVLKGDTVDFYNQPGRATGGQGPGDQVNFWANYQFTKGVLKNYGVGLGGNYASKYRVVDNSATGVFDLPSYTLINAGVFYNNNKYRINFNANNITNKQYYIGYWSVNPQAQRSFTLSVAYKF
ncbi:MAG: TonB-dependent receptor [Sphingobacteriaceae bacterium]|nr:MAG: TonB-dependent receptor [Sphingobacteriaceae bacterium]